MQGIAETNTNEKAQIGGVFQVRISDLTVDGDTAQGTACDDYGRATFSDANGPDTPAQAGFGQPWHKTLTLSRIAAENRWMIASVTVSGTC
jgi:hypothetical protein